MSSLTLLPITHLADLLGLSGDSLFVGLGLLPECSAFSCAFPVTAAQVFVAGYTHGELFSLYIVPLLYLLLSHSTCKSLQLFVGEGGG